MYTQCPKCLTIFEVSEEILAIKEGLVRCGDCENVFNATWNLVNDPDSTDSNQIAEDSPIQEDNLSEDATTEDLVDLALNIEAVESINSQHSIPSEFDDPEDAPFENPLVTANREDTVSNTNINTNTEHGGLNNTNTAPEDDEISDEDIRRTLKLDEKLEYEPDISASVDPDQTQSRRIRYNRNRNEKQSQLEETQSVPDKDNFPDNNIRVSIDSDRQQTSKKRIEPRLGPLTNDLSVNIDDALRPSVHIVQNTSPKSRFLNRKPAIKPNTASASRPDTARLRRKDPNAHWVSIPDNNGQNVNVVWAIGVLLVLVFSIVQIRFLLIDDLFAIPEARPYANLFCEFTGCKPPLRIDPASINIAQTRVDLHPEVPGALRLKINLINKASYPQPYPPLQVTLSDKDGRIVGRRTYRSNDYQTNDDGEKLLDPGILAIATLNLAHPNENAVGFETILVH